MWCSDCKALAKADCKAGHTLKSPMAALTEEEEVLQLRVLELARRPGATLELSVRVPGGEEMSATWKTWTTPAAVQRFAVEMASSHLIQALATEGLWKQQRGAGEGGQDGAETAPGLPVLEKLDVEESRRVRGEAEVLQTVRKHRVRRLTNVWFSPFGDCWSLQLLKLVAPHVEELEVTRVRREHLQVVLAMPRLRRLNLFVDPRQAFPAELPPPPAHYVGLRWLRVCDLPRDTTCSLLRAHAKTLEELELFVGTAGVPGGTCKWPERCVDLHALLGGCGFARLRKLELVRFMMYHDQSSCVSQVRALRGALPGVEMDCSDCPWSVVESTRA